MKEPPPSASVSAKPTCAQVSTDDDLLSALDKALDEPLPPCPPDRIVTVHVCVDSSGKLTEDPTVLKSSGDPRYDKGALMLAREASGRYKPSAMKDGKPVARCFGFRVKFSPR